MFNRSRSIIAIAAALIGAGYSIPAIPSTTSMQLVSSSKRRRGVFNGVLYPSGSMLIGSRASRNTVTRDKRASSKRRNQQRHKRLQRG